MMTRNELEQYLRNKEADFSEINQPLYREDERIVNSAYDIEVEFGDWKHSHQYLTYILREIGYEELWEHITEEDGSDCYSSVHRYVTKDLMTLIKLSKQTNERKAF